MNDFQVFWMVWCEDGFAPTVRHNAEQSARQEAERLARKSPGQRFCVLQLIAACEKVDVVWIFDKPPGIPF